MEIKNKLNWSKILLDFYPHDLIKQFKKVSLPLYIGFSFLFFYILYNLQPILLSKIITLPVIITFYFLFPIVFPLLLLGLLLSSFHILRHNNPFLLYYISFKQLFVYLFNIGMIFFCFFFLLVYLYLMNAVFGLI